MQQQQQPTQQPEKPPIIVELEKELMRLRSQVEEIVVRLETMDEAIAAYLERD